MLSKGPLRLETARMSSQASCAIQLGWRRVGSKSESAGTGEDVVPRNKVKRELDSIVLTEDQMETGDKF